MLIVSWRMVIGIITTIDDEGSDFLCDHKEICQSVFNYSTSSDELYKQKLLSGCPEFYFSSSE